MGNCKDCKYWVLKDQDGVCIEIDTYAAGYAYIAVSQYDAAELVTPPDFGCVLFEQKESE